MSMAFELEPPSLAQSLGISFGAIFNDLHKSLDLL